MQYVTKFLVYAFEISFTAKVLIHMYLDDSRGEKIFSGPWLPFKYFFSKYTDEVGEKLESLKRLCNYFYYLYVPCFLISMLIGIFSWDRAIKIIIK
jgi:hypothetical protein